MGDSHLSPDDVRNSCERSLSRMGTDYIDLYLIHWPNHEIPIADTMGALQGLVDEGPGPPGSFRRGDLLGRSGLKPGRG